MSMQCYFLTNLSEDMQKKNCFLFVSQIGREYLCMVIDITKSPQKLQMQPRLHLEYDEHNYVFKLPYFFNGLNLVLEEVES